MSAFGGKADLARAILRNGRPRRLPVTLLICADELCIGQYVALHYSPICDFVASLRSSVMSSA